MKSIRRGTAAALSLFAALQSAKAFQFQSGDLKGSFDTTLSLGGMYRLRNPDPLYYSTSSSFRGVPGLQNSGNADDGDLNFPSGIASEMVKASHDLELRYHNVGGLIRGYYFQDNHVMDYWKGRTQLSDEALRRVGRGAEWLDMYGYYKFEVAGRPVDLRIGRQVLSLGESTFIPNGINVVNSVDLAKLRVPGAELKEALLPVNMVKASWALTENLTVEPFWLLEFRRNEIEPDGTYFSTNDYASKGGSKVMLGFGALSDQGTLGAITRVTDKQYNGRAQGGLAAHLMAPALNDTEFGFYYVRYNSRSPVISARTPTSAINTNLVGPLTQAILSSVPIPTAAQIAAAQAQAGAIFTAYVTSLTNPGALTPTQIGMLQSPTVKAALAGAQKIAFLNAANTGTYWVEFPEGIDMVGLSFNTNLAKTGISWQGEMSYKKGVPLQVDDVELLFAALGSLNQAYASNNQIGNLYGKLGQEIQGWRRHDVWTAQTSMTKVFAPALGASQLTVVGEVGGMYANLPSKDVLRYEGSGTFTSGSAIEMAGTGNSAFPATPYSAFADSFSWGYQLLARAEYTNVFGGVNVTPSLAFNHDVSGNSPLPLATFIRGRKSITVGVDFNYMNRWTVELRYVNYFGAERYNLLNDRDYVSGSIKYSF